MDIWPEWISIDFLRINFFVFSLVVVSIEKMPRQCLTTFPNTSKLAKNTPLRVVFSALFSVGNAVKHGLSWLMYYFKYYLEHLINGFQQWKSKNQGLEIKNFLLVDPQVTICTLRHLHHEWKEKPPDLFLIDLKLQMATTGAWTSGITCMATVLARSKLNSRFIHSTPVNLTTQLCGRNSWTMEMFG